MSNYTKTTNFTAKDALTTGNPDKAITGTAHDVEYAAIAVAIATKADSNSPTLVTPALGTPASGVMTNVTGTAAGLTAGNVTTNANLTGHITSVGNAAVLGSFTSAQLATALTDETGSGAAVFATSPTLVTPILGTPTSGTLTNCTASFAGAVSGTSIKTTGTGTVDVSANNFQTHVSSAEVQARFVDIGESANNRIVDFDWYSGGFHGRFVNDAYSTATDWMTVTGGYAAGTTSITFTAPTVTVTGQTTTNSFATTSVTNTASTYTVLTTDHTIRQSTTGSTYTLPTASSFPGRTLHIFTQFAGEVISASSNVVPLAGGAQGTAILPATEGSWATLQSDGVAWYIIASN